MDKIDIKTLIEDKFKYEVESYDLIGEGYDSKAYLINNEYIFKIKISNNPKKGYEKEKAILDFINNNLETTIQIPKIDYIYVDDNLSVMGYKKIKGKFLSPKLYNELSEIERSNLKNDIANFLKQLHSLDYSEIDEYKIDNKSNCLEEYDILKKSTYESLSDGEKTYIEEFYKKLNTTDVFNGRKCLCHNDFSCNHILLDDNNKLCGIIDFGDSGIIDEYCDFLYLLENSEEEIGRGFGIDILNIYKDIDIDKAIEYQNIVDEYWPIETMVYGIINNKQDFIDKGRLELDKRIGE